METFSEDQLYQNTNSSQSRIGLLILMSMQDATLTKFAVFGAMFSDVVMIDLWYAENNQLMCLTQ